MERLNSLFGAETKKQFINSLPEKERETSIAYFVSFNYAENMYSTHLFDMDADTLISVVQMSLNAPSGLSTARRIKTFLVKYCNWAKENGVTKNANPLHKVHPIKFCSELAIATRYPKSIDDLYELLMKEDEIGSCNGKWAMFVVSALLIYDGIPDDQIANLKMSDINWENKTMSTEQGLIQLSDLTLASIETLHSLKVLEFEQYNKVHYVKILNSEYVLPRIDSLFQPLTKDRLLKAMSKYKAERSEYLKDATWFTVDSIADSGHFYRIYSGKIENDLDPITTGHLYKLWTKVHYQTK